MERPFTVRIEEKRSRDVTVKAVTVDEAIDMVDDIYRSGAIKLDHDDVEDVEYMCSEEIL